MIPDWFWLALAFVLIVGPAVFQVRKANRRINNFRDIEAERMARQNSAPLGSVSRWIEK